MARRLAFRSHKRPLRWGSVRSVTGSLRRALFFAFTTIIGRYFFAEQNVKYLFGVRWVSIYRVLVLGFIMLGSFLHVTLVWELADLFNGLMVIPNVIALIGLSKLVGRALEDYDTKFTQGQTPEFGEDDDRRLKQHFTTRKPRRRRTSKPPVDHGITCKHSPYTAANPPAKNGTNSTVSDALTHKDPPSTTNAGSFV